MSAFPLNLAFSPGRRDEAPSPELTIHCTRFKPSHAHGLLHPIKASHAARGRSAARPHACSYGAGRFGSGRYLALASDATWKSLSSQLSTEQLLDLVFAVGQYNLVSMALNTLGVQLDEGVPGFPD